MSKHTPLIGIIFGKIRTRYGVEGLAPHQLPDFQRSYLDVFHRLPKNNGSVLVKKLDVDKCSLKFNVTPD